MIGRVKIAAFLIWLIPAGAICQQSGFDILTIGPNTRALGMNEVITATSLGASNLYANPANLAFEPSSSLSADYSLWIADLNNSHVAVNFKTGKGAVAVGLLSSIADDFQLRERPGPSEGEFSVSYFSAAAAYARRIKNFAVGATIQYLREELYIHQASGYAFNLGLSSHWMEERLTVATTLRNAGQMGRLNLESTTLPTQWRTGLYARLFSFQGVNRKLPVTVSMAADLTYPLRGTGGTTSTALKEAGTYVSGGIIFEIAEILQLHAGYRTDDTERPFSLGTALNLESIKFDYAFVPFTTGFGNAHSIGISYTF